MRQSHLQAASKSRRHTTVLALFRFAGATSLVLTTTTGFCSHVHSFRPSAVVVMPQQRRLSLTLYSSVGPPNKGGADDGKFGDFLIPRDESENMLKAREYMNENSLPISYDSTKAAGAGAADKVETKDDTIAMKNEEEEEQTEQLRSASESSQPSIDASSSLTTTEKVNNSNNQDNPYIDIVSKISPSDLISKFSTTAHPRVQTAVRNTILGLLGGLPKMAFDTTSVTTGQKLASLMFQLQMTGYMFKSADYRLSLEQSLGVDHDDTTSELLRTDKFLLAGTPGNTSNSSRMDPMQLAAKVHGKLRVKLSDTESSEVDAAAYVSELRSEVNKLRDELDETKREKVDAVRKDLLRYIRTLPQRELQSLTNTMSPDVLNAMKGLVNAVLLGIGEGERIQPDTITEQSSEAMAQLCMWQLVIGYNLRTLEVREEIKKSLKGSADAAHGGISLEPGALE